MEKSFFSQMEEKILKFWKENKIFKKSIEQRDEKKSYVFYDGPPFANSLPHYGHILQSVIKDIIPRYWTMKGYRVERRWGWDCHGLPVENSIEKELNLKSKKDIEEIGINKFNEACRASVLRYTNEWRAIIERTGRWVDMDNDYKTMDLKYMESVWWVFKSLWEKGLVCQNYKSMHICPRCETTLSNFEVTLEYKNIKDLSVIAKFELIDEPNIYILAWTTTPWTLPGNVALAINSKINYVKIRIANQDEFFILAKERISVIKEPYEIIEEFKGEELIGKKYKPLFDYYSKDKNLENCGNGWKIYPADFVSIEEGTGVVHIAPAFGEDDMNLRKENNLPFIQHVGMNGRFIDKVVDFKGMEVKSKDNHQTTDIEIIKYLTKNNQLFSKEKYEHSYPYCWRCDTPLLNYATNSWFVKVTEIKDNMIKNNQKINWIPGHIKDGRFGKWLENSKDWAISRSRYWGAVLPVWKCDSKKHESKNCENIKIIGSIEELEKLSGQKIEDLHKHIIDKINFKCEKCGGTMKRIPEVFDCWFESGSMPYAQEHYPFENKEKFEKNFPANFIAEGQDQTRGWFYTLIILSTALFNKPAFENVIVTGMILAEDGKKMAKRLQNYPDPKEIFGKYSADSMRFYLASSPATKAENLFFSEKGVDEINKKVLNILWNVYKFYELYSDKLQNTNYKLQANNILDQWILAKLNLLIKEVTENMDKYKIFNICKFFEIFINEFSTWYIRRSRERFKLMNGNNQQPLIILRYVLLTLSKLMAPFTPFITEEIYQKLLTENMPESVHLCDWPKTNKTLINKGLEEKMDLTRKIVSLALAKRIENKIKVRQPLASLKIKSQILNFKNKEELLELIKQEINVKEIVFDDKIKEEIEINTEITQELREEGIVREIIRHIQQMRKKAGLKPENKILIKYFTEPELNEILIRNKQVILKKTRAERFDFEEKTEQAFNKKQEFAINEQKIWIKIVI